MRGTSGATVLVTGSTDGLGKLAAKILTEAGAVVLLHGRDETKGKAVLKEIGLATGSTVLDYYNADLSSLENVRRLASDVTRDHPVLDVLANNAGIGIGRRGERRREVSADGHELRFAVNYLAPYLLTHLLLPNLRRAAPSRVVNVASLGQSELDFSDLMLERGYEPWRAYGQSKLALVMFTFDLAERLKGEGIAVNAVHPGSRLDTKMVREAFERGRVDPRRGADAIVHLATSPELEGVTGKVFDGRRETRADQQAYDRSARKRLQEISDELTGIVG